jgi:hypothetical protein
VACVHNTTDCSTRSSSVGTVYVSAVSVSSNLTLKAIAYKTGMTDILVGSAACIGEDSRRYQDQIGKALFQASSPIHSVCPVRSCPTLEDFSGRTLGRP